MQKAFLVHGPQTNGAPTAEWRSANCTPKAAAFATTRSVRPACPSIERAFQACRCSGSRKTWTTWDCWMPWTEVTHTQVHRSEDSEELINASHSFVQPGDWETGVIKT